MAQKVRGQSTYSNRTTQLSDCIANGNPEKISGKNSLKKSKHIWMKIGWRQAVRCAADRLLLLLLLALYLHFFDAHTRVLPCAPFYFFFVFLFSGNWRAVPPPPYMNTDVGSKPTELWRCLQSTSGRTFKLALIKYWLRVVFSLTSRLFVFPSFGYAAVGYVSKFL